MALVFGIRQGSLPELAAAIESAAGIRFSLHDSLFPGGDYYRFDSDAELVFLQTNNDGGPPDESAEEDFPDFPFLVYVYSSIPDDVWIGRLCAEPISAIFLRKGPN